VSPASAAPLVVIVAVSKNIEVAQALMSVVQAPMMFLSGSFLR